MDPGHGVTVAPETVHAPGAIAKTAVAPGHGLVSARAPGAPTTGARTAGAVLVSPGRPTRSRTAGAVLVDGLAPGARPTRSPRAPGRPTRSRTGRGRRGHQGLAPGPGPTGSRIHRYLHVLSRQISSHSCRLEAVHLHNFRRFPVFGSSCGPTGCTACKRSWISGCPACKLARALYEEPKLLSLISFARTLFSLPTFLQILAIEVITSVCLPVCKFARVIDLAAPLANHSPGARQEPRQEAL